MKRKTVVFEDVMIKKIRVISGRQSVALMTYVPGKNITTALSSRSRHKAITAVTAMQIKSKKAGRSYMSLGQINTIISKARKKRREINS